MESREDAGAAVGAGGATIDRAGRVLDEAPDLADEVRAGDKTVNAALRELKRRNGEPAPPKPKPELKTARQRQIAGKAKERVQNAASACRALSIGIDGLKVDAALAVATPDEVRGWTQAFREGVREINRLHKQVKEATTT